MLKFGQNEVAWADISDIALTSTDEGCEVSITIEEVVLVVGIYQTADRASSVFDLIESAKVAASFGGVTITIIIDDL